MSVSFHKPTGAKDGPTNRGHNNAYTKNSTEQETPDEVQMAIDLDGDNFLGRYGTSSFQLSSNVVRRNLHNILTINSPGQGWPTLGER